MIPLPKGGSINVYHVYVEGTTDVTDDFYGFSVPDLTERNILSLLASAADQDRLIQLPILSEQVRLKAAIDAGIVVCDDALREAACAQAFGNAEAEYEQMRTYAENLTVMKTAQARMDELQKQLDALGEMPDPDALQKTQVELTRQGKALSKGDAHNLARLEAAKAHYEEVMNTFVDIGTARMPPEEWDDAIRTATGGRGICEEINDMADMFRSLVL